MSDIAILAEGLGKRYVIGGQRQPYKTIRETLGDAVAKPIRWWRSRDKQRFGEDNTIWALKDVSFEVQRGEAVGIIGRNGAGKTTLLKLLSRITEPTEGYAEIRGRVGALLEVGTGFHPELTGRDNIYLNGAILGMKKADVERQFDEIVAFAEVEKFIDTPVKHYSSGMYVRLAFAVAAHLEPEILMVDEVLAVGDYQFQKKCLGKMGDIGREGRTVLLISHNMPAIINLCQRAILLDAGRVAKEGQAMEVVQHYLATTNSVGGEAVWPDPAQAPGSDVVRLHAVRVLQDGFEGPTADVDISKEVRIHILYRNLREGAQLYANVALRDQTDAWVFSSSNARFISLTEDPWYGRPCPPGLFESVCHIPGNFLNEGLYCVRVTLGTGISDTHVLEDRALSFRVHDTGEMRREYYGKWPGTVRPRLAWHTEYLGSKAEVTEHAA